jgi:hypothetical protein
VTGMAAPVGEACSRPVGGVGEVSDLGPDQRGGSEQRPEALGLEGS